TILPLLSEHILFVFNATGKSLMQKSLAFEHIIQLFSQYKRKLNIKNNELLSSPLGVGRSGPYTFYTWDNYTKDVFLGCVQSSVIVDVKRFFDEYTHAHQFMQMMEKTAQALFQVNALQRRYAQQYFPELYRKQLHHHLFSNSAQLIRFWNIEFEHPHMN